MGISKIIPDSIKSKFIKNDVKEKFTVQNVDYCVVDFKSSLPFYKDKRYFAVRDKEHGRTFFHSGIYLSEKEIFQPVFYMPQQIASVWNNVYPIKNALVLGCAGCSMPRFLILNNKNNDIKVTGVEYVKEFTEIAKKYFFVDSYGDKFNLVCDDAFKFVASSSAPKNQDFVFVDVFDGTSIPNNVFADDFLKNIYNLTSENSIVVVNLLTLPMEKVYDFINSKCTDFSNKILFYDDEHRTVCLTKNKINEGMKNKLFKSNKNIKIKDF